MYSVQSGGGGATVPAVQNSTHTYAADAEASDAYVIVLDPPITAYANGQEFTFKANTANTGAASLVVDGLAAITIKKFHDQDLGDNDIESGSTVTVIYDGTNFQMSSQLATEAGPPTTIMVADESTDTTSFPLFVTEATGDLGPKTASGLTFNAATDTLGVTALTVDSTVFYVDASNDYIGIGSATGNTENQVHFLMNASKDILIDGSTNPRTIDTGILRIELTPAIENTRAITINLDVNSLPNSHAQVTNIVATALAPGETVSAYDTNVDRSTSTGGVVRGYEMSISGVGTAVGHLMHADPGIVPLSQFSGTFENVEQAWGEDGAFPDVTVAFNDPATDVEIFPANADNIHIGMVAVFDGIEVNLAIVAGNPGIKPIFTYSSGGGTPVWTVFTPQDETQGFKQSGVINWFVADLTAPTWAVSTINGVSKFWIRITRNQVTVSAPTEDTIQVASTILYSWDENGVITGNTIEAKGDTAAGDTAAMGYTATEGLILTGQGSTYDIVLKNDADVIVADVATGSTILNIPGSLTISTPLAVTEGGMGAATFTDGAILLGSGTGAITTLDVTAKGSVLVGDGTGDPIALTVGTNDQVLTADSAQASGMKWAAGGGGDTLPIVDTTAVVKGSADDTKLVRIEADGLTTGTTRVINVPDVDVTLATPTELTKLSGIEVSADITDATNVDAAGAVMNTDADAKGDLMAATADNALARLAVGTNDQVLTADSAQASGMKWATGGAATKEFFVPALSKLQSQLPYTDVVGRYALILVSNVEYINFLFHIPDDFTSIVDAVVVCIPDATETIQWDTLIEFAAADELHTANSDSETDSTKDVQDNQIEELDFSASLTGIAAGDYVGFRFESDTDQIRVLGLRIKYT